jgi:hydrogenase/urease accessory protein HupE
MLNRLATRLKRVASRAAGIAMLGVMLSTLVMAHVMGPSGRGLAQGFTRPFSGLDHILAMVAVSLRTAGAAFAVIGVPLLFSV